MVNYILNDAWYDARKKNKEKDAEQIIATAAKLIMADIRVKEYDTSYYPNREEILNKNEEWLPKSLKKFFEILIRHVLKQQSIGQSILYAARPRSVLPPIPFYFVLVSS